MRRIRLITDHKYMRPVHRPMVLLTCLLSILINSCGKAFANEMTLPVRHSMGLCTIWPLGKNHIGIIHPGLPGHEGIEIWDAASGKLVSHTPLPGLDGGAVISTSLAVCVDYKHSALRIVTLPTGKNRYTYPLATSNNGWTLGSIALSLPSHVLAWVETKNSEQLTPKHRRYQVTAVDIRTGNRIARVTLPLTSPAYQEMGQIAVSPDGTKATVGSGTGDYEIGVIDLKAKKLLWQKRPKGGVWDIAFCPDGKSFFTTDDLGQVVRYDTVSGKVLSTWRVMTHPIPVPMIYGTPVPEILLAIDVSPSGKYVAVGTTAGQVLIWNIATGRIVKKVQLSSPVESALAWTKNSSGVWAAGTIDRAVRFIRVNP